MPAMKYLVAACIVGTVSGTHVSGISTPEPDVGSASLDRDYGYGYDDDDDDYDDAMMMADDDADFGVDPNQPTDGGVCTVDSPDYVKEEVGLCFDQPTLALEILSCTCVGEDYEGENMGTVGAFGYFWSCQMPSLVCPDGTYENPQQTAARTAAAPYRLDGTEISNENFPNPNVTRTAAKGGKQKEVGMGSADSKDTKGSKGNSGPGAAEGNGKANKRNKYGGNYVLGSGPVKKGSGKGSWSNSKSKASEFKYHPYMDKADVADGWQCIYESLTRTTNCDYISKGTVMGVTAGALVAVVAIAAMGAKKRGAYAGYSTPEENIPIRGN